MSILKSFDRNPAKIFAPGSMLITEGGAPGSLFVLESGEVEVVRHGMVVATISDVGAIIGEMSVLLDQPHSATVRSRNGAEVYAIADPDTFLDANPSISRQIASLLAVRLQKTTALLVDMRQQAKEREDLVMFDKIFALLK